jgi:hypothetical protein
MDFPLTLKVLGQIDSQFLHAIHHGLMETDLIIDFFIIKFLIPRLTATPFLERGTRDFRNIFSVSLLKKGVPEGGEIL